MTHTRLWIAATIIAVIILASFVLSVPHTRDVPLPQTAADAAAEAPVVTLHDAYRKGAHTLSGSIEAPNPCTSLDVTATLQGTASSSEAILVSFSMPKDTGVCVQQAVNLPFSVTISAPDDLPISATVNGVPATVKIL